MKLLSTVDVATQAQRGARYAYIELHADVAAWLIDQYQLFQRMLAIPGPRPLWTTFVDEHVRWYGLQDLPAFSCFNVELTDHGFVRLPDHFVPEGPAFSEAELPNVKGHMNISGDGVSWHVLLRGTAHHATPPLREPLLRAAAGIILPAVSTPSSTDSNNHG